VIALQCEAGMWPVIKIGDASWREGTEASITAREKDDVTSKNGSMN